MIKHGNSLLDHSLNGRLTCTITLELKSPGAHLQHSRRQVDGHKDGGQGGVSALHQVDCVEEDQVTGDHQKEKYLGRAMIGSWDNYKNQGK